MLRKTVEYIRIPKRYFFGGLALVGVIAVAIVLKPNRTPVDLTRVTEGVFQKSVVDEATTAFRDKFILTAPADGLTPELKIKAGDKVKRGQTLGLFRWDRNFKLESPVDGFVLNVFEKDKRHVPRGTPILEVGSPEKVEVVAKLLSEEMVDVKVGQKALITKWGKERPLEARVEKIEPSAKEEVSALGVKEQRVNVHLNIVTDRKIWDSLGDGYRVEVAVITREEPESKLLPLGALFSNEGQPSVFVVESGKISIQPVELGDRNREFAELQSDLAVGTELVLYPGSQLKPGDKIIERSKR